jgi:hypothetical protein
MADMPVTTIRTDQQTVGGADGTLRKVYRVFFKVGESGPFSEDFSEVQFTPEIVKARLEKVASTIRAIY